MTLNREKIKVWVMYLYAIIVVLAGFLLLAAYGS